MARLSWRVVGEHSYMGPLFFRLYEETCDQRYLDAGLNTVYWFVNLESLRSASKDPQLSPSMLRIRKILIHKTEAIRRRHIKPASCLQRRISLRLLEESRNRETGQKRNRFFLKNGALKISWEKAKAAPFKIR